MSIRNPIGPELDQNILLKTSSGDVTMVNETTVIVKKSSGAATQVTLPATPPTGGIRRVVDGKGDAATNNITVVAASGNINGAANHVISENYGVAWFLYNGTEWNVLAQFNAVSAAELGFLNGVTAGTITASKAVVADTNGAVSDPDLLLNSTNEINLTIGGVSILAIDDAAITGNTASASTAGKDVFIETQDGGASAADAHGVAGGDYSIKTGDGANGGAHTANNPNGGAAGNYTIALGSGGAAGAGGAGTAGADGLLSILAGTRKVATGTDTLLFGTAAAEGWKRVVVDKTVSPAAVETAVFTVPKGSVIEAVLANVQSALTGGGTTVTWSVGLTGDPDAYGTAGFPTQADSLAKDSKSSFIATPTLLTADEPIVLSGAATGGAADGDTALTVGSVRVVIIYKTFVALANAP